MKQTFTEQEQVALESLVHHPGWQVYESIIQDMVEDKTTRIMSGDLSYEAYCAETKTVEALLYALKRPSAIIRQRRGAASA